MPENAALGTLVGQLTAADTDAGDVHTFELVTGTGDADNAMFVIEGHELKTAAALDFETQNVLQIRVRAVDRDGLSLDKALLIAVTNVNEPPVNEVPGLQTTGLNQPLTFSSANGNAIRVSDADAGSDNLRVRLVAQHGAVSADELFGNVTELNQLLDGIVFTPELDFLGEASLEIITDDLGHNGAGGPLTDADVIAILVN